jgi:protein-S-isoprenylcysteine O-methyltransferase Ste14
VSTAIYAGWLAWGVFWMISALGAKSDTRRRGVFGGGARLLVAVFVLTRVVLGAGGGPVHVLAIRVLGTVTFVAGVGLTVWARIHLGRNWGMPMTEKQEPELVTSGPYRLIRHPIYTGILLAMLGTGLAADVRWLVPFAISAGYFVYSARVEEGLMAASFPATYSAYRKRTKMLIPFVL